VGSIGVRKGIHLLLDYWVKAKLNAKLKLVGAIEDAVKPLVTQYLSHENIEHIPFTSDLPSIYKNADIFILPSLEEGSPLVMYMALGAGLPVIVSPMGGGGVIVDNEDGFVVDPHDADKWIERMRQLAESAECRAHLSRQSKVKATHYVWDAVAKDRLQSLAKAESEPI
jgi:glycosyltransferase involved in cell wall biosynthesis